MAPALGKIITKLLSRLLGKYLCMKTFFKILFVWQENDLGFSSDFEKIALQKKQLYQTYTHTTLIKIWHDKGSISGPRGKGSHTFYETIKLVFVEN